MKLVPATDTEPILIDSIIPRTVQKVRIESNRDKPPSENTAAWYSVRENLIAVPTLEDVKLKLEKARETALGLLAEEDYPILHKAVQAFELLCSEEGNLAYLDFLETHESIHSDQDARFNTRKLARSKNQLFQDFLEIDPSSVDGDRLQRISRLITAVIQHDQNMQAHKETQAFFETYSYIYERYGEEITSAIFTISAYPKFRLLLNNYRAVFSDINTGIFPYKTDDDGLNIYGEGFQDFSELAILAEKPNILQHIRDICATPNDFANFLLDRETELTSPYSSENVCYFIDKKHTAGRWFARDIDELVMDSAKSLRSAIGDVRAYLGPSQE